MSQGEPIRISGAGSSGEELRAQVLDTAAAGTEAGLVVRVAGTVSTSGGSSGLTDAELRATPVPVSMSGAASGNAGTPVITASYFSAQTGSVNGATIDNRTNANYQHDLHCHVSGGTGVTIALQISDDGSTWTAWTGGSGKIVYVSSGAYQVLRFFVFAPYLRWVTSSNTTTLTATYVGSQYLQSNKPADSYNYMAGTMALLRAPADVIAPLAGNANGVATVGWGFNSAGSIPYGTSLGALNATSDVLAISDQYGTYSAGYPVGTMQATAANLTLVAEVRNSQGNSNAPWEAINFKNTVAGAFGATVVLAAVTAHYNLWFDMSACPGATHLRLRVSAWTAGSVVPYLQTTNNMAK